MENNKKEKERKGFSRFLYNVFVHNFGYKAFAIIFGAIIWTLTVVL